MKGALIAWLVVTLLLYFGCIWWCWDEVLSNKRRSITMASWHGFVFGTNAVIVLIIGICLAKPLAYVKYLLS